ncbi:uncharacterized protein NP_6054A (plasmid) [Natronomonas pharaonis DSM 2160]|uniref:Uncharacterized protein n=1 Tax=Natronomonas pharaonis (strain ATCC 35678 / DSM 2160 / CIP 103997 / JCM 8858 / NBRC 14720 / NCIMB 2260 / Gabara) TaxID=348780 RepID=Q3IM55_NATPD|nr:hypothetical protein [Natronomonas pharaonis]CAI50807.3 uncharacterized protein NP_6054A [Natronomonas pharaonis DSM 2160]
MIRFNVADGPLAVLEDSPAAAPFEQLAEAVADRVGVRNRAEVADIDPEDAPGEPTGTESYLEAATTESQEADVASKSSRSDSDSSPEDDAGTDGLSGGLDISEK